MTTAQRRAAARAHQRAAAFVRFHMLGDHEAMAVVLAETADGEHSRLAFVTALASIAGSASVALLGADGALAHLRTVAASSALLSEAEDIDRYFDGLPD
jgi:hypothetical protein